jgi:hypothetical protein
MIDSNKKERQFRLDSNLHKTYSGNKKPHNDIVILFDMHSGRMEQKTILNVDKNKTNKRTLQK